MPLKKTQYRLSAKLMNESEIHGSVLDIGGGTGAFWLDFPDLLNKFASVTISDISNVALGLAQENGFNTTHIDLEASCGTEFKERFDFVCCFEVLEHLQEDRLALDNCYQMLRPGGRLFVSVPRSMRLWSACDIAANHVRRYETRDIIRMLQKCGFVIAKQFTWGSFLVRLYQQLKKDMPTSFGRIRKESRLLRFIAICLFHLFMFEDLVKTERGLFLYICAIKPNVRNSPLLSSAIGQQI